MIDPKFELLTHLKTAVTDDTYDRKTAIVCATDIVLGHREVITSDVADILFEVAVYNLTADSLSEVARQEIWGATDQLISVAIEMSPPWFPQLRLKIRHNNLKKATENGVADLDLPDDYTKTKGTPRLDAHLAQYVDGVLSKESAMPPKFNLGVSLAGLSHVKRFPLLCSLPWNSDPVGFPAFKPLSADTSAQLWELSHPAKKMVEIFHEYPRGPEGERCQFDDWSKSLERKLFPEPTSLDKGIRRLKPKPTPSAQELSGRLAQISDYLKQHFTLRDNAKPAPSSCSDSRAVVLDELGGAKNEICLVPGSLTLLSLKKILAEAERTQETTQRLMDKAASRIEPKEP